MNAQFRVPTDHDAYEEVGTPLEALNLNGEVKAIDPFVIGEAARNSFDLDLSGIAVVGPIVTLDNSFRWSNCSARVGSIFGTVARAPLSARGDFERLLRVGRTPSANELDACRAALDRIDERSSESVEQWAERLGNDFASYSD